MLAIFSSAALNHQPLRLVTHQRVEGGPVSTSELLMPVLTGFVADRDGLEFLELLVGPLATRRQRAALLSRTLSLVFDLLTTFELFRIGDAREHLTESANGRTFVVHIQHDRIVRYTFRTANSTQPL